MFSMTTPEGLPLEIEDRRRLLAAEGYLALGMPHEAEAELSGITLAKRRLPEALGLRIALCQQTGAWESMRETACHLATIQPSESQWWISWAYAVRRSDSLDKALEILLQAKRLHAGEAILHFNLACYLAQLGRLEEARASLREAIRLHKGCRRMARDEPDLAPLRNGF
jgi:Flp pilus assembly protein TadD